VGGTVNVNQIGVNELVFYRPDRFSDACQSMQPFRTSRKRTGTGRDVVLRGDPRRLWTVGRWTLPDPHIATTVAINTVARTANQTLVRAVERRSMACRLATWWTSAA